MYLKSAASVSFLVRSHVLSQTNALSRRCLATKASLLNKAYKEALVYLDQEKSVAKARIAELEKESSSDAMKEKALYELDLAMSDPTNHRLFNHSQEYDSTPVMRYLHDLRFKNYVAPQLLKEASKWGLFKDVFPQDFAPSVQFSALYGSKVHLGTFGFPIRPESTAYTPTLTITTNSDEEQYFTLLMTDLDRPNLETREVSEWCHWLVTDIPVTRHLVIPGGVSPFFNTEQIENPNPELVKEQETHVKIPGKEILPYIPPHPTFSNPRSSHRYVFTLLRQSKPTMGLDIKSIVEKAPTAATSAELNGENEDLIPARTKKAVYGEGEIRLQVRERGLFLPTMKFALDHDLQLAGFGFITSTWNIYTPQIFTGLGIHEPVYGRIEPHQIHDMARRVQQATDLAQSIPVSDLNSVQSSLLQHLNKGERVPVSKERLPTKRSILVEKRLAKDAAENKSFDIPEAHPNKLKRLSLVGAAGVIRSKEGISSGALSDKDSYQPKSSRYAQALTSISSS